MTIAATFVTLLTVTVSLLFPFSTAHAFKYQCAGKIKQPTWSATEVIKIYARNTPESFPIGSARAKALQSTLEKLNRTVPRTFQFVSDPSINQKYQNGKSEVLFWDTSIADRTRTFATTKIWMSCGSF